MRQASTGEDECVSRPLKDRDALAADPEPQRPGLLAGVGPDEQADGVLTLRAVGVLAELGARCLADGVRVRRLDRLGDDLRHRGCELM